MLMGVATGVHRHGTVSDTPLICLSSVNSSAQVTAGNDEVVTIDKHCFVSFSVRPTTALDSAAKIRIKIKSVDHHRDPICRLVHLHTSSDHAFQPNLQSAVSILSDSGVCCHLGVWCAGATTWKAGCVRISGPPFSDFAIAACQEPVPY